MKGPEQPSVAALPFFLVVDVAVVSQG